MQKGIGLLIVLFGLYSCQQGNAPEKDNSLKISDSAKSAIAGVDSAPHMAPTAAVNAPQVVQGPNGQMVQVAPPVASGQPVTMNPQTQVVGKGMNPAHGQPGHRCDIAVGAPLNSKPGTGIPNYQPPAAGTVTSTSAAPSTPTVISSTTNKTTAPGMNPPHGEPGHRCDISVGAPLNSKPAAAPPVVMPNVPKSADAKFDVIEGGKGAAPVMKSDSAK